MGHCWAQCRRMISFARCQTESLRHIYLGLNSDMNQIPRSNGAITSELQDATKPPTLFPPGNVHPNSSNIIRALDEVLSELRSLEIKYMFDRDPSNIDGAALNIPFRLRLKFRIKGQRDLKAILAELGRHNEDLKAMAKELRKIVRWKLEISARRMQNVEPSPTAGHITPPEVESSVSMPCIENSNLDAPYVGVAPPPPVVTTLPPAHASMPPRAGDTTAIDNPPRPPSSHAGHSLAGSGYGIHTYGREFQSSDSFSSHERQDNYSIHTGDKICTQCHQVWRRDSNS